MVKKFSALALTGLLALPLTAGAASQEDLQEQIDNLSQQLEELKADQQYIQDDVDANIEDWNLASRFKFSGDFRARVDSMSAEAPSQYSAGNVADSMVSIADAMTLGNASVGYIENQLVPMFRSMSASQRNQLIQNGVIPAGSLGGGQPPADIPFTAATPDPAQDYDNDSLFTNRLRLNMQVKAMENVTFKGRLAMYKTYGGQSTPLEFGGPFTTSALSFDGTTARQPDDNDLIVDQAYVNWNNIADLPIWFSIGRRPTTDGPPEHIRMGNDPADTMATPTAFMNYPFDGATFGYAYFNPLGNEGSGRVRLCIGRGFESGVTTNDDHINDTDFAGINWDVYKKDDLFINFQSFRVFNMFNIPSDVDFPNILEMSLHGYDTPYQVRDVDGNGVIDSDENGMLDRTNLGDIQHTSFAAMDKWRNLNYFLSAGWSRTDPSGVDEMGTGLLTSWWDEDATDSKDGYSVYAGARYDLDDLGLKLGLEYNFGSEDWISFTPGHDDLYQAKLATRGSVYEAYMIYDIPAGWKISEYSKAFMRLGYQHYDYDYTGSGFWLGEPQDIDDLADDPLAAQMYPAIEEMDQVYLTFEARF
ncbi:MAG: DUF3373 family protein [Desulfurivibrionaceae bacterium]